MRSYRLTQLPMLLAMSACGDAGASSTPQASATPPAPAPFFTWQPGHGLTQIPLWPDNVAIANPEAHGVEGAQRGTRLIGGQTVVGIGDVRRPTMTIYPAQGHNTGVALMVYPGGGYQGLAIDLEGSDVCDWAAPRGITCVVLKYRVPQTWWHDDCGCQRVPTPFMPLQDAQRAMVLVRQSAARLRVDPRKIGVVGFSAGGHLVTAISNASGLAYAPVDAADRLSARPDFQMPIYPGHLWAGDDRHAYQGIHLYAFDPIRADAPPAFIVQAEDDPTDDVRHSVSYFDGLRAAHVPAELHIYAHGGHAFGVRPSPDPITHWPDLALTWLHTIGML